MFKIKIIVNKFNFNKLDTYIENDEFYNNKIYDNYNFFYLTNNTNNNFTKINKPLNIISNDFSSNIFEKNHYKCIYNPDIYNYKCIKSFSESAVSQREDFYYGSIYFIKLKPIINFSNKNYVLGVYHIISISEEIDKNNKLFYYHFVSSYYHKLLDHLKNNRRNFSKSVVIHFSVIDDFSNDLLYDIMESWIKNNTDINFNLCISLDL